MIKNIKGNPMSHNYQTFSHNFSEFIPLFEATFKQTLQRLLGAQECMFIETIELNAIDFCNAWYLVMTQPCQKELWVMTHPYTHKQYQTDITVVSLVAMMYAIEDALYLFSQQYKDDPRPVEVKSFKYSEFHDSLTEVRANILYQYDALNLSDAASKIFYTLID